MREHFPRHCGVVCPVVMAGAGMMLAVVCLPSLQAGEGCDTGLAELKDAVSPVTLQADDESAGEYNASEPGKKDHVPSPPLVYVYNRDRTGLPRHTLFEEPARDLFVSPLCQVNQYTSTRWGQSISEQLRFRKPVSSSDDVEPNAWLMHLSIGILDTMSAERQKSSGRCSQRPLPRMVAQCNEYDDKPEVLNIVDEGMEVHFGWYPDYGKESTTETADYDRLMIEEQRAGSEDANLIACWEMREIQKRQQALRLAEQQRSSDDATARERFNEDTASEKLNAIQQQLAELIKQQPDTRAGRQAAAMIDAAGLKIGPGEVRGLYPKDVFFFGGIAIAQ